MQRSYTDGTRTCARREAGRGTRQQADAPLKHLADVRQVHLDAVLVLVHVAAHVLKLARCAERAHRCVRISLGARRERGRWLENGPRTFEANRQVTQQRCVRIAAYQRAAVKVDMVRGPKHKDAAAARPQVSIGTRRQGTQMQNIPAQTHGLQSLDILHRYSDSKSIDFIIINTDANAGRVDAPVHPRHSGPQVQVTHMST
jgi:hypothetical protein